MFATTAMIKLTEHMIRNASVAGGMFGHNRINLTEIPDMVYLQFGESHHIIEHKSQFNDLYRALSDQYSVKIVGVIRVIDDESIMTFSYSEHGFVSRLYKIYEHGEDITIQFANDMSEHGFEKLTKWFNISPEIVQPRNLSRMQQLIRKYYAKNYLSAVKFVDETIDGCNFIDTAKMNL